MSTEAAGQGPAGDEGSPRAPSRWPRWLENAAIVVVAFLLVKGIAWLFAPSALERLF